MLRIVFSIHFHQSKGLLLSYTFLKGVNQAIELELLLTLTQISEGIFHPKVLLKLNFGNSSIQDYY